MNLNDNPTTDQLRELLRGCDDRAGHHVLWVDRSGEVRIDRFRRGETVSEFEARNVDQMQLRFEPFQAGNEYVGPDAAVDGEWVTELFDWLVKSWPEVKGKAEVAHRDY